MWIVKLIKIKLVYLFEIKFEDFNLVDIIEFYMVYIVIDFFVIEVVEINGFLDFCIYGNDF